jgi:hypothetical protein
MSLLKYGSFNLKLYFMYEGYSESNLQWVANKTSNEVK